MVSHHNLSGSIHSNIFKLEREQFGQKAIRAEYEFDQMRQHLMERLRYVTSPINQVRQLNHFLFKKSKCQYSWYRQSEDFTLTGTILNRSGNCLGLTSLFYTLSKELDIPVQPLLMEGHITCGLLQGKDCFYYIELTRGGTFLSNKLLHKMYHKRKIAILSDDELYAVQLTNHAVFYLIPQENKIKALKLLKDALEIYPGYCGGRINLIVLLLELDLISEAAFQLEQVYILHPEGHYLSVLSKLNSQIESKQSHMSNERF